ncbi:MAG TPA: hypothetical protein VEU51_18915 [Candidatus Acidoferrales bacterium]|nr:hypothetical protein [Candidatus Acidoferrales bacterium]
MLESVLREFRSAGSFALFVARLAIHVVFRIEIHSPRVTQRNPEDEANLATVIAAMKLHHR